MVKISVILHCLPIQIGWYAGTLVRYQTVTESRRNERRRRTRRRRDGVDVAGRVRRDYDADIVVVVFVVVFVVVRATMDSTTVGAT